MASGDGGRAHQSFAVASILLAPSQAFGENIGAQIIQTLAALEFDTANYLPPLSPFQNQFRGERTTLYNAKRNLDSRNQ